MQPDVPIVVVAEGGLPELREMRAELLARGVAAELQRPPPERCGT